jgi:hypothetical protein
MEHSLRHMPCKCRPLDVTLVHTSLMVLLELLEQSVGPTDACLGFLRPIAFMSKLFYSWTIVATGRPSRKIRLHSRKFRRIARSYSETVQRSCICSRCMTRTFRIHACCKQCPTLAKRLGLEPDQDLSGHEDFTKNQLIGIIDRDL